TMWRLAQALVLGNLLFVQELWADSPSSSTTHEKSQASEDEKEREKEPAPLTKKHKKMTLLDAEKVTNEEKMDVMVATGHVKISSGKSSLMADKVVYDRKTDRLFATGNVVMRNEVGVYHYSNYVELSGDLKEGMAHELIIVMEDKSRLAGRRVKYRRNRGYDIKLGTYSPCKNCEIDPDRPLVWDLRAPTVYYDTIDENMTYYNMSLNMFGIPVMYLPFLRHAGPRSPRRSGFLWPQFMFAGVQGLGIVPTYVICVGVSHELLLKPLFTQQKHPVLWGMYNARFYQGSASITGSLAGSEDFPKRRFSLTNEEEGPLHYFLTGNSRLDLTDHWRTQVSGQMSSERSYSSYPFGQQNTAVLYTNQGSLEGFYGRHYMMLKMMSFFNARKGEDPSSTPYILPQAEWNGTFDSELFGGIWTTDLFSINMDYPHSKKDRRVFLDIGWRRCFLAPFGQILTLSLDAMNHFYSYAEPERFSDKPNSPIKSYKTTNVARTIPGGSLFWRWPWALAGEEKNKLTIEPIVGTVFSEIPPKDYQIFVQKVEPGTLSYEINEWNFFAPHRMPKGNSDEPGGRLVYGARSNLYTNAGMMARAVVGQSYTLTDPQRALFRKEGKKRFSEILGSFSVFPGGITLTSKGRYNTYMKRLVHFENTISAKIWDITVGLSMYNSSQYNASHKAYTRTVGGSLKLNSSIAILGQSLPLAWACSFGGVPLRFMSGANGSHTFNLNWVFHIAAFTLSLTHTQTVYAVENKVTNKIDLTNHISRNMGLSYTDECLTVTLQASQSFTTNEEVSFFSLQGDKMSYSLNFVFKNLGSLSNAELGNIAQSLDAP
ncbi:MAG: LPS assembly protein LptD, partial [Holosporales bacterium]|nr:LPS assembly protein LptD [Holosporales bacterium]